MDQLERLGLIQLSVGGGKKLSLSRVYYILGAKKPSITQDIILLLAECRRIGMPENTFFNLDKSLDQIYIFGRARDFDIVRYDARVSHAILRAEEIEKGAVGLPGLLDAGAQALIFVSKYLYELREQKYGTN